jgi:flagellar P-ring protein FlgI
MRRLTQLAGLMVALLSLPTIAQQISSYERTRDRGATESVHKTTLVGYGLVVGLHGTGDRRPTTFSTQLLDNLLLKMRATIPAASLKAKNVAAVFVLASLAPSSAAGSQINVTVSSIGDATSLEGGALLPASLYAVDGQAYAEAQGPVTRAGHTAERNSQQTNRPVAGFVLNGGLVERSPARITTAGNGEVGATNH